MNAWAHALVRAARDGEPTAADLAFLTDRGGLAGGEHRSTGLSPRYVMHDDVGQLHELETVDLAAR